MKRDRNSDREDRKLEKISGKYVIRTHFRRTDMQQPCVLIHRMYERKMVTEGVLCKNPIATKKMEKT